MYKSFKDMPIWNEAMNIATSIFAFTEVLPKKEDYGLTSQIRRSALSISANIAESFGRNHTADKINFLYFSRGSITETQSHLEYGKRVGYFTESNFLDLNSELEKIHIEINKIIKTLKTSSDA